MNDSGEIPQEGLELPTLNSSREVNAQADDIEANRESASGAPAKLRPKLIPVDPKKLLEPIRTDPVQALEARKRRLDRVADSNLPEIHYIGQISSAKEIIYDVTEGAFCRWKIEYGKVWQHLSGDLIGQTQVAYAHISEKESLPLSHPLDAHFAVAGLQGWGSPRLSIQSYRLDHHGRKILSGYGFVHLPLSPGPNRIELNLWRPVGTPDQELIQFLLGQTPALLSDDPIYETAWQERCRLLTVASGTVFIDLFVVTRFLVKQGLDE